MDSKQKHKKASIANELIENVTTRGEAQIQQSEPHQPTRVSLILTELFVERKNSFDKSCSSCSLELDLRRSHSLQQLRIIIDIGPNRQFEVHNRCMINLTEEQDVLIEAHKGESQRF